MTLQEFYSEPWFQSRPASVQELFRVYPVNREWFMKTPLQDRYYGVRIIGVDEHEDEPMTFRVYVGGLFGLFPRDVFGVKPEDIYSREFIASNNKDVMYHTENILLVDEDTN